MRKNLVISLLVFSIFFSICPNLLFAADTVDWVVTPDVYYKLEAPLPGTVGVNNLVEYLTTVYNLALSLVGILSTVMIIYGGFRWAASAGNDSAITAAKETITGALIGLIIAVGSYTILNFINPQLVSLKSGYVLKIPVIAEEETSSTAQGAGISIDATEVVHGVRVAKTISSNVNKMLTAMTSAGLNYSGSGGYRSAEEQVAVRQKNCHCGTDTDCIYTKPSSQCTPHTAIPGSSMHEQGQAIDFKCNGKTIPDHSDACFTWLKDNAATYGFKNYAVEPWHWSTNGK